jgi:hypothetical protein
MMYGGLGSEGERRWHHTGVSQVPYDYSSLGWANSLPRPRERVPTNSGIIAASRFAAQRQQLESLNRFHERQVEHLPYMRQAVDQKQHQLSRLRMAVSALPTERQVSELKEDIQTLEIDLHDAHEQQRKMNDEDLYTDEGVRWYCRDCSFLNHPLMTFCEKCNIPRLRTNH